MAARYRILKQMYPGKNKIWVARLERDDFVWEYAYKGTAEVKAEELQSKDEEGRKYKVVKV